MTTSTERIVTLRLRVPASTGEGLDRLQAVGIDHGIVHPMTTYESNVDVHHYHHRDRELGRLDTRAKKVQRSLRNCTPKSREWRRRQRLVKSLRGRVAAMRSHTRRQWAVGLAKGYDTLCVERMNVRNLVRSARGTHENKGKTTSAKRTLSRLLANAAPGEQQAELKAACERHGATYIETPARNSSNFCPECHHCTKENRKSQARFRCTKCGHTKNADANAARNHLLWGTSAKHRAAVRGSWEETPKRHLITYEAQLPAAGGRWQGFRRLRDDLSGRIDRRFGLSNDPPTAIDHHVRPQAELRT